MASKEALFAQINASSDVVASVVKTHKGYEVAKLSATMVVAAANMAAENYLSSALAFRKIMDAANNVAMVVSGYIIDDELYTSLSEAAKDAINEGISQDELVKISQLASTTILAAVTVFMIDDFYMDAAEIASVAEDAAIILFHKMSQDEDMC
jgi:hypothetical protein